MDTLPGARPQGSARVWSHRTGAVVAAACVAVVLARLTYVMQPLRSDEGGYLFVARHWQHGGEFLYGDYHVDRPPLLLAIFRLAALSDWDRTIRVMTIPFAVAAVIALARAGFLLGGRRGARWSAVVAAALVSSPALAADQADGELFAVPFVACSVALALESWRRQVGTGQVAYAVGAGVSAGAASLVKQNFLEGLVFVAVLVTAESVHRGRVTPRCLTVAVGTVSGALVAYLIAYSWATSRGLDAMRVWTDLVSFRAAAISVIWEGSYRAPTVRAATLAVLALVSAMIPLAWTWLRWVRGRGGRCSPQEWAVTGTLLFGLWAMLGGGSYWPHYLLQGATALATAAGLLTPAEEHLGTLMRRWAVVAACSSATACAVIATVYASVDYVWHQERIGHWLAASSAPDDTAIVAYGNPSILEAADLTTPYPYLWSLPMRTLDPEQRRLRRTLRGENAPTWLIQMTYLNSWDIDRHGKLQRTIEEKYDAVEVVCGYTVYLRAGLTRELTPPPRC